MSEHSDDPQEFARQIGDIQRHGDDRVHGLGRDYPKNIPVGIPPPALLHVQAAFDTRPIGAYDFALEAFDSIRAYPATIDLTTALPAGYTAVLRRVQLDIQPSFVGRVGASGTYTPFLQLSLLRTGSVIPSNTIRLRGSVSGYEWPTHQVFGFFETLGIRVAYNGPALSGSDYDVTARFFGTLIPTKGMPPPNEIASGPTPVRVYAPAGGPTAPPSTAPVSAPQAAPAQARSVMMYKGTAK